MALTAQYIAGTGETLVSGRLSAWNDQSGNGYHMSQGTSGLRPYSATDRFGDPCVRFIGDMAAEGKDNYMGFSSAPPIDARSFTMVIVHAAMSSAARDGPTATTYRSAAQAASNNPNIYWNGAGGGPASTFGVYDGSFRNFTEGKGSIAQSSKQVTIIRGSASNCKIYTDGSEIALGSALASGTSTVSLFANIGTLGAMQGEIYEIRLYNTALSDGDRDTEASTLASTYTISTESRRVFFVGDSLTFGHKHGTTTNANYLNQLTNLFETDRYFNLGVPSATTVNMETLWGTWDVLPSATVKNIVIIWGGTNDISLDGVTVATLQTRLDSLVDAIRATLNVGDEIYAMTCIDRSDANDTKRTDFNAWLNGSHGLDIQGVIDMTGRSELNDSTSATYFNADGIHLIGAGYAIVAEEVDPYLVPPSAGQPFRKRWGGIPFSGNTSRGVW